MKTADLVRLFVLAAIWGRTWKAEQGPLSRGCDPGMDDKAPHRTTVAA